MEKLFNHTKWNSTKESGIYLEDFHIFDNGRKYSNAQKLDDVLKDGKISFYYSETYKDSLKSIEQYRLDIIERICDENHTLTVAIKDKKHIRTIAFKHEKGYWNLIFKEDGSPAGFASSYVSGPGWPSNINFKEHVESYREYFDELIEHCPHVEKSLKTALKALEDNAKDVISEPGTISFSLK